jgi:3-phosphoshikimate 1-carboxyvinyltransferase
LHYMLVKVKPSQLHGTIEANVSKSYAQRAYALAALASSKSSISKTSWSDDAMAALGIVRNLGADVSVEDGVVCIEPNGRVLVDSWDVGEAGLSLRMFAPIAALHHREITIEGRGSLLGRPTDFIAETLIAMGATVEGKALPLKIRGPLQAGTYQIDGNFSSQLLTGLLIALPTLNGDSQLIVDNLKSIPYIDMTMEMIKTFGGEIRHDDYRTFDIRGGQTYTGTNLNIEADWSGLAFILVAGAIARSMLGAREEAGTSQVVVMGVKKESFQADKAIVDVLQTTGCEISFAKDDEKSTDPGSEMESGTVSIAVDSDDLRAFSFDATHCPDLIPPLCILATQCTGESRIFGVHRLQHKESDRALTLRTELRKLGARVDIEGDVMIVRGKQDLTGAETDACGDHRIAMTLVCAGLVARGETRILGAECISKSYHKFYTDIHALHGNVLVDKDLINSKI